MTVYTLLEKLRQVMPEKQVKGFSIEQLFHGKMPKLDYNPFGGLTDEELETVLNEQHDLSKIVEEIKQGKNLVVEFIGKKGRGKTTHLRRLAQLMPEAFYFNPDRQSIDEIEIDYPIILIDSFHKLPIVKRQNIMKKHRGVIVHTDHVSRFAEYFFCGKKWKKYLFKGLTVKVLNSVILERLGVVMQDENVKIGLDETQIKFLLDAFGDDFRGILNYLYGAYRDYDTLIFQRTKK
jgi:hypothetical protein